MLRDLILFLNKESICCGESETPLWRIWL